MNLRVAARWAVGVTLAVTLAACGSAHYERPPQLVPEGEPPGVSTVPPAPRPLPNRLEIPSIGVDSTEFMPAGLDAHHELIVPPLTQPKTVAWYSASPVPGDVSQCGFDDGCVQPSVLHGHINGDGVNGVFAKLAKVKKGAKVAVHRSDGKTAHFTVTKTMIFPKSDFPTKAVYGLTAPSLVLITCGPGDLVRTAAGGNYQQQTVVQAALTSLTGP